MTAIAEFAQIATDTLATVTGKQVSVETYQTYGQAVRVPVAQLSLTKLRKLTEAATELGLAWSTEGNAAYVYDLAATL